MSSGLLEGLVETYCSDISATSGYLNRRRRDLQSAEKEVSNSRKVLQRFRKSILPDVKVNNVPEGDR